MESQLATAPPPTGLQVHFEVKESNSSETPWILTLHPEFFRLEKADGEQHDVPREELNGRVQTFEKNLFLRRAIAVKIGRKQRIFKLSEEAFAALIDWIGPPTMEDLKFSLKRRFSWVMPIGLLFVFTALPIGGLPGDMVTLLLGIGLILTGVLAKVHPHRVFFALDSLWFTFLATTTAVRLAQDFRWISVFFLVLQVALVKSGWSEYARFAPHRMAPGAENDQIPNPND